MRRVQPIDFTGRCSKHTSQEHFFDPQGVRLRVAQGHGGAPRAAKNTPLLDLQMRSECLHVFDHA